MLEGGVRVGERGMCLEGVLREVVGGILTHLFPPFQHLLSERLGLSDSKCWNLVAKTQRSEQMG